MQSIDNFRVDTSRKAVITGVGVVAPGEPGAKPFWEAMTAGKSATGPIT
jgi:act minimal PKS ketosynthase (KS/KS alpha)